VKARHLIAEGALDPSQLDVLFRAFDLAWANLASETGCDP
jgi:hypothetical protein